MKSRKKILELMLKNKNFFVSGLCRWNRHMLYSEIINREEFLKMNKYIRNNHPDGILLDDYYWERGKIKPRIEWIEFHIKKLTK